MDITSGLCSGFDDKLGSMMGNLDQIKSAMSSPMSMLKEELSKLEGGVASPVGDMEDGLEAVTSAATDSIPSIPDVSDIEDILKDCSILQGNLLSGLQSPASLISGFLDQAIGIIGDAIGSVLDLLGDLLEAPAAFLINQINNLLEGFGLGSLLAELDGLFNCLDSVCGTDVSGDIDQVNGILDALNLDEVGKFDITKITDGMNIPTDVIKNVTTLADTIKEETAKSKEGLTDVGKSMSDGLDKIIDANIDSETTEELVTVVEAEKQNAINQKNNLKSFFT